MEFSLLEPFFIDVESELYELLVDMIGNDKTPISIQKPNGYGNIALVESYTCNGDASRFGDVVSDIFVFSYDGDIDDVSLALSRYFDDFEILDYSQVEEGYMDGFGEICVYEDFDGSYGMFFLM